MTVFAGVVTVVVGAVPVFCWVTVVGLTVVEWPTLSDWFVTVGVDLELLSETSTTTKTISAMTTETPTAIAQPLPPPWFSTGGW